MLLTENLDKKVEYFAFVLSLYIYYYSSWSEIIAGVPKGSILGPLLFNIFLSLLLYPEETFLINYANDKTLYSIGNTIESVKKALSNDFRIIQN